MRQSATQSVSTRLQFLISVTAYNGISKYSIQAASNYKVLRCDCEVVTKGVFEKYTYLYTSHPNLCPVAVPAADEVRANDGS